MQALNHNFWLPWLWSGCSLRTLKSLCNFCFSACACIEVHTDDKSTSQPNIRILLEIQLRLGLQAAWKTQRLSAWKKQNQQSRGQNFCQHQPRVHFLSLNSKGTDKLVLLSVWLSSVDWLHACTLASEVWLDFRLNYSNWDLWTRIE